METRSKKKIKLDVDSKGKEKQEESYYSDSEEEEQLESDSDDDCTIVSSKPPAAAQPMKAAFGGVGQPSTSSVSMLSSGVAQPKAPAKSKSHGTMAAAGPSKGRSVTFYMQRELSDLANMDDMDILVAPENEDQLSVILSVILGSCDTPYAFGFFHFRGTYPSGYPNAAPHVVITTTEHGRVRFNPNLYADGKVCLSILGTWRGETGEQWSSAQSTYTILRSIQSLLHSLPYVNEPGYENLNQRGSKDEAEKYNLKLAHETVRVAVCGVMESIIDNRDRYASGNGPSYPFHYILKHWFLYYHDIHMQRCEEALKDARCADGMPFTRMPFEGSGNQADGKFQYTNLIQRLKNIKAALEAEEEDWITQGKALTANRASCAQHLEYERLKFEDSVPEGISASPEDDNMFVWTASIFDNLGPYAGGCFQVRLVFSKNYTEGEPPRVRFLSPIFHPQITANDYRPRLSFRLPAPKKGTTIRSILEECQSIVRNPPTPDPMLHVNPEAAKLLREDPAAFAKRVHRDVARSLEAM